MLGDSYKYIDKFITRKDLYERININVYIEDINYSLEFKHVYEGNIIKTTGKNPRDEIEKILKKHYSDDTHITLSVIYESIDNKFVQQDFLNLLRKFYNCTPEELKNILKKFNTKHNFL
jgi:hypothetical protein